jgi:transcriptional regulator with XRE-family HTH domain
MIDNCLGDNLRKIRKLYERKQTDVAAYIGISTRQYRKMENDEIAIKDKYLLKLADCYSITIDTLREFSALRLMSKSESAGNQVNTPPYCFRIHHT